MLRMCVIEQTARRIILKVGQSIGRIKLTERPPLPRVNGCSLWLTSPVVQSSDSRWMAASHCPQIADETYSPRFGLLAVGLIDRRWSFVQSHGMLSDYK
jgi:hypothetical protein